MLGDKIAILNVINSNEYIGSGVIIQLYTTTFFVKSDLYNNPFKDHLGFYIDNSLNIALGYQTYIRYMNLKWLLERL